MAWLSRTGRTVGPVSGLTAYDRAAGDCRVAGVDEVGRGCLAGPLIACAVLFDYRALREEQIEQLAQLDDSKRLSARRREQLYPLILNSAARFTIALVSVSQIDRYGVHKANLQALRTVAGSLASEAELLLVDGFSLGDSFPADHRKVIKGDATSAAIAAASIVAKVTRDRLMCRLDTLYPGYSLARNAGYLSAAHAEAVRQLGPTPIHRRSFNAACYDGWIERGEATTEETVAASPISED